VTAPLIVFAHAAYRLEAEFARRGLPNPTAEVRRLEDLEDRIGEAGVVVCSFMWRNGLIARAPQLRMVQSVSAGTDQFDRAAFAAAGVRLASGQGVNERAVAEHAMAMILAAMRRLPEARDNQARRRWRPMIGDPAAREDELGGKTMVILGLGRIGRRLARLARAFEMRVIGVRRSPATPDDPVDQVLPPARLAEAAAAADILVLTCPITPETRGLVDAGVLAAMRPTAWLCNVARGGVVVEPALVAALEAGRLAGALLDVAAEEPLPAASPLWAMPNVLITPHAAGETSRYEINVVDLLVENLGRLEQPDTVLRNEVPLS